VNALAISARSASCCGGSQAHTITPENILDSPECVWSLLLNLQCHRAATVSILARPEGGR
jgi:hypothetical protein